MASNELFDVAAYFYSEDLVNEEVFIFLVEECKEKAPAFPYWKFPRSTLEEIRGGSRKKSDQGSTKSSWAWLNGCGKYLRTINNKGPVGPTFIIDLKFDILHFSKEAIKHVFTSLCFVDGEYIKG